MATFDYSNQLRFTGTGYLDAFTMPVESYEKLASIPRKQRFEGLEIVVLHDEKSDGGMSKYWLSGGTSNACWVKKEYGGSCSVTVDGDDQENNF